MEEAYEDPAWFAKLSYPKGPRASQETCEELKYMERKPPQPKSCSKPAMCSYNYEQVEIPVSGKTSLFPQ